MVFGKADAHLPLLTQFYQLDIKHNYTEPGYCDTLYQGEIDQWLLRCLRQGYLIDPVDVTASEKQVVQKSRFFSDIPFDITQENLVKEFCSVAVLHQPLTYLMDSCVHPDRMARIRDEYLFEQMVARLNTLLHKASDGLGFVIVDRFKIVPKNEGIDALKAAIFQQFIESVQTPANTVGGFAWCKECNSVFVATKRGQMYCSHRCGDRVSKRRKRDYFRY